MSHERLTNKLLSPFYIFIRCGSECSDAELLQRFGLAHYQPSRYVVGGTYTTIGEDSVWKMLADDWSYTLWHQSTTRPAIDLLAHEFDLFTCSVGDCDHSFDFAYYRASKLIRKYVVDDPNFTGHRVVEDFGEPIPSEVEAFQYRDESRLTLAIAASIGIKTDYTVEEVRYYVKRVSEHG